MQSNITGVQGTLNKMKLFDAVLYKQMNKQIKAAMIPIRDKARADAPQNSEMLSGWTKAGTSGDTAKYRAFPKYDQTETRDGIVYKPGKNTKGYSSGQSFTRRWQLAYFVANNSAGGAIYETAGRRSGLGGRSSSHTISSRHKFNKRTSIQSGTKQDNNSLNPNAGRQLMSRMGPLVGSRSAELYAGASTRNIGRLIYKAWSEDQGKVRQKVDLAIDTAVKTFNSHMTADKMAGSLSG